jgi:hypothetical protein
VEVREIDDDIAIGNIVEEKAGEVLELSFVVCVDFRTNLDADTDAWLEVDIDVVDIFSDDVEIDCTIKIEDET